MSSKLKNRTVQPELMDAPGVSEELLTLNLKELDILNQNTGGHSITLRGIKQLLGAKDRAYTIIDLGCGSGDTLKYIANWGRKNGYNFKLIGIDNSPVAISYLNENCINFPEITGITIDANNFFNNNHSIDIVVSSLFFHHLSNIEITTLLKSIKKSVSIGFVINDLQRSKTAYWCTWLVTRLLNGSELSKHDGPLSILNAFKRAELMELLNEVQIHSFTIQWQWIFRFLVVYKR